jgi:hypothetical protein
MRSLVTQAVGGNGIAPAMYQMPATCTRCLLGTRHLNRIKQLRSGIQVEALCRVLLTNEGLAHSFYIHRPCEFDYPTFKCWKGADAALETLPRELRSLIEGENIAGRRKTLYMDTREENLPTSELGIITWVDLYLEEEQLSGEDMGRAIQKVEG